MKGSINDFDVQLHNGLIPTNEYHSNIIILSPKAGSFATRFAESGAAVRIGDILSLLKEIRGDG